MNYKGQCTYRMLKNKINEFGEYETYRFASGRYKFTGKIRKIDEEKDLIFLYKVSHLNKSEKSELRIENYINYTNSMKKMDLNKNDIITFKATLIQYSVAATDLCSSGKQRLINVRDVEKNI